MKLERYCARCARENKQIKPEYLKSHGSPTYHPKATALCPKHGIAMPLVLRLDEKTNINLVSLSNENQDVVEALVNHIHGQEEVLTEVKNKMEESWSRLNDLEDALKKKKTTRKKTT